MRFFVFVLLNILFFNLATAKPVDADCKNYHLCNKQESPDLCSKMSDYCYWFGDKSAKDGCMTKKEGIRCFGIHQK